MDGKSDREGMERRKASGHVAKQAECDISTDVYITKLADGFIGTITICILEETSILEIGTRFVQCCQCNGDSYLILPIE